MIEMTKPEDRIRVFHGDSRDVLKTFPDAHFDSVVCDPPYALVSITKRFGAEGAASAQVGASGAYARASAGFMGQKWDTGETAFAVTFWAEVMRVLKPGGHVIAFSGTRTYHRLAVAIEDAGFEIRDMVAWLYGSGFPKSHDVSKGIDKRGGNSHLTAEIGAALATARKARGISKADADKRFCGGVTLWSWYEGRPAGQQMPTSSVMADIASEWPELARYADLIAEAEREVVGVKDGSRLAVAPGQNNDRSAVGLDITASSTAAARQWSGWGTALKPALEPVVLARKPLIGTVAANVLQHGTGALNIDASRIDNAEYDPSKVQRSQTAQSGDTVTLNVPGHEQATYNAKGRWPANVLTDGSEEVVGAFPETGLSSDGTAKATSKFGNQGGGDGWASQPRDGENGFGFGDSGSASRFFYSAKADAEDRLGSRHPTVKPVDLMAYLVRLVTPPGGVTLDPFAGSGTTGVGAMRGGFGAVLIEREDAYVADIMRKLAWARGEGRLTSLELARLDTPESQAKASGADLPLFG